MTRPAVLSLGLTTLAILGCSGGGGTNNNPVVASIAVSLSSNSVEVDETVQASATPRDTDGNPLTRSVTWSSSNNTVASVSTSGVVTGVTAGSANIIATIGTVTGQAALTVTSSAAQITGLTLTGANGQPLSLGNVAGTIGLDFTLTVPAGQTGGTLVVTINGVEFAREPANTAPAALRTGAGEAAYTGTQHVMTNTAQVNYTLNGEQISALPRLGNTAGAVLQLAYLPPGVTQPSATAQSTITLANPDAVTGRVRRQTPLVLIDGKNWSANDIDVELIPIQFGADAIQSVEVRAGDYQAEFGSGAIGGVINVVTRTGTTIPNRSTLTRSGFRYESNPSTGTNFFFSQYRFGTTDYSPQTAEPARNGNCLYTRGTGVIQPLSVANPVTLATGCTTWVRPNTLGASHLTGGWEDISTLWFHDSKEPTGAPGAYTLATRPTTPGASAFGPWGGFGVLDNHIGATYNPVWGLDLSKITDQGSGIDLNQSYEWHASTNPNFTPGPSTLITDYSQLIESGATRNYFFKTGWLDKVGNKGFIPLTTRLGNAWTIGNQLSLNLGVDLAAVSINNNGGTATYNGPQDGFVNRNPNPAGLGFGFNNVGSSPVGYAANGTLWARIYQDLDVGKPVYGEGATTNVPWWVATDGVSPNLSLSWSNVRSLSASRNGGSGEGVFTGFFGLVDRSGAVPLGGFRGPVRWVDDFTEPTAQVTGSGPFIPGSNSTVTATLFDPTGLDGFRIGPVFSLGHTGFDAGFAYVMPGQFNIGTGLGGPIIKNHSRNITNPVPYGMVFYNPFAGNINGPVYNTIGVAVRARDLARNWSPLATLFFANTAVVPVPTDPIAIRFSASATQGCRGSPCGNGSSNLLTLQASWDSPFSMDPLNKFEYYTLSADKRINFLGKAAAPTVSPITGGFRYSVSTIIDLARFCGPAGFHQLIGVGQSANGGFWYKNDSFLPLTLFEPSVANPYCATAERLAP
jgi:hypothetical protein